MKLQTCRKKEYVLTRRDLGKSLIDQEIVYLVKTQGRYLVYWSGVQRDVRSIHKGSLMVKHNEIKYLL